MKRSKRGRGGGGLLFPTKFSIERTEIILKLGEFSYREGGSLGGFMKYFDFDKSSFFYQKELTISQTEMSKNTSQIHHI